MTEQWYQSLRFREDPGNPLTREERLHYGVKPLLNWYGENARDLPWRKNPEPYRVWISEIMLQQTRVEAVKPYFARFMETYPTIGALAQAQDDQLMKLWEGLGYYSRARNLKKAAREAVEHYQGQLPADYQKLLKLPGIGPYTAGAIASIAYQIPVPAVDGNVLRVVTRLQADPSDITQPAVKKQIEKELKPVMPEDRPGDFNQALMELGAVICVPNGAPKCGECPWEGICLAQRRKLTDQIPVKSPKKARKIQEKTIFLIQAGEKTAVRRRDEEGLLAGMYEFPSLEGKISQEEVEALLSETFGPEHEQWKIEKLPEGKHIFTHLEWHMTGWRLTAPAADGREAGRIFSAPRLTEHFGTLIAAGREELKTIYPVPSAYRVYSGLV